MKTIILFAIFVAVLPALQLKTKSRPPPVVKASSASGVSVSVTGSASFVSETSIGAISVHGTSTGLKGTALVTNAGGGNLVIGKIDASVPAKSFKTGMALRDKHTLDDIFTKKDGGTPDLHFTSAGAQCKVGAACSVPGTLSIQGIDRPFALSLTVKAAGSGWICTGSGTVSLTAYGIKRPTQLTVRSADAVSITMKFASKGK